MGLKYLTANKGILTYITPDTWLSLKSFKKIRKITFDDNSLESITSTLYNTFDSAIVDSVVFSIKKGKSIDDKYRYYNDKLRFISCDRIKVLNDYVINFNQPDPIVTKIDLCKNNVNNICEVWQGLIAYAAKNQPREYTSFSYDSNNHRKLLYGGSIGKYEIKWTGEYLKYGSWLHRPRPEYIFSQPKIIVQRIRNPKLKSRLVCAYDNEGFVNGTGLSNLVLREQYRNKPDIIKFLLAVLNSTLINYWFGYYYHDVNIKPEQIRNIPIQENVVMSAALIELVDKILNITKSDDYAGNKIQQAQVKALQAGIDLLVYKLYNLTEDEIKLVEASTKN